MTEKNYSLRLSFTTEDSDGLRYDTTKTAFLVIGKDASISRYLAFVDDLTSFQKVMKKLRRKDNAEITIDLTYTELEIDSYHTIQQLTFSNILSDAADFTNGVELECYGQNTAGISVKYSVDMTSYALLEQFNNVEAIANIKAREQA